MSEPRIAIVLCGALGAEIAAVARKNDWALDVTTLSPLLHNRPERIAPAVDQALNRIRQSHVGAFIAYADCGTGGALDTVLESHRRDGFVVDRLPGAHCYDVYAGVHRVADLLAEQPGTYLLTNYLVRSFDRIVWTELGLDRYPDLVTDYFGRYTRVVWLRQDRQAPLLGRATRAARCLRLPLEVVDVGTGSLDRKLESFASQTGYQFTTD